MTSEVLTGVLIQTASGESIERGRQDAHAERLAVTVGASVAAAAAPSVRNALHGGVSTDGAEAQGPVPAPSRRRASATRPNAPRRCAAVAAPPLQRHQVRTTTSAVAPRHAAGPNVPPRRERGRGLRHDGCCHPSLKGPASKTSPLARSCDRGLPSPPPRFPPPRPWLPRRLRSWSPIADATLRRRVKQPKGRGKRRRATPPRRCHSTAGPRHCRRAAPSRRCRSAAGLRLCRRAITETQKGWG